MSCRQTAIYLGDAPRTVEYWVLAYESRGLAGLREKVRAGRPPRLSLAQLDAIGRALRQPPDQSGIAANLWDGTALAAFADRQFPVRLGVQQCQRLFRGLGFRLHKPRPEIAHADPELQRAQKKLQALMTEPDAELWAQDEVHFQQHGSRCRMWIPPEVRDPGSLHHPTRKQVGYFGAVRLSDGRFHFRRETGRFNAQTCWTFLRSVRRTCRNSKRRIVVIADNAKFHHALLHKKWRERVASEFELSFLPPCSPELNPFERVWTLTRRRCLHNKYFPLLTDLIHDVENQFHQWRRGNATLRRPCANISDVQFDYRSSYELGKKMPAGLRPGRRRVQNSRRRATWPTLGGASPLMERMVATLAARMLVAGRP